MPGLVPGIPLGLARPCIGIGMAETSSAMTTPSSLDHFIGARDYGRRDRDAQCIGGFEIDCQLEFARLFDRNVRDLDTAEQLQELPRIKVADDLGEAWPIGDKSAFFSELRPLKHCRQ